MTPGFLGGFHSNMTDLGFCVRALNSCTMSGLAVNQIHTSTGGHMYLITPVNHRETKEGGSKGIGHRGILPIQVVIVWKWCATICRISELLNG